MNGPLSSCASQSVFPATVGCGTSSAVCLMMWAREGDAPTSQREPETETSTLRYATTWSEIQVEKSSPHSVLPTRPYWEQKQVSKASPLNYSPTSSASQLAMTTGKRR